jgi:glycosyltransferase involved in cell wall biosynthesis
LAFTPPHKVPKEALQYAIPVFAWEFDTIPNESWQDDDRNNWYHVFRNSPGSITHCQFSAEQVKNEIGDDYPIAVIPAPLWDKYAPLATRPRMDNWTLSFDGYVADSWSPPANAEHIEKAASNIDFNGVVYTFVFNPNDGRKQWTEAVTAFIAAHENNKNATLILKLIQSDPVLGVNAVWDVIDHLGEFDCRIVAIQSHLEKDAYDQLIAGTTFALNSSRGEGQCLPLLEFMSAGTPAVAPCHTAMTGYIFPNTSFIVENTKSWHSWPHDPRMLLRCFHFPVVWDSLRNAFLDSYKVATEDSARYDEMAQNATRFMKDFCSEEVLLQKLKEFIAQVKSYNS